MTNGNFEMLGREMEQFLIPKWGAAGKKSLEELLKEKIQYARTPEVMVRSVIEAVLTSEFGPGLSRQSFYARMVASITTAMMANSEVKNRLLKMAVKYLDTESAPVKKNKSKKKNKKLN